MLPCDEALSLRYSHGVLTLKTLPKGSLAMIGGVYLDDSGTHNDSPCIALGGYVSTPEKWQAFSREWREALDSWGLEYFHMTDFHARQGPYKHWPEKKREPRLARLYSIINRNATAVIGYAIVRKDLEVLSPKALALGKGPYLILAHGCMVAGLQAAEHCGFERLEYVFEDGVRGGKGNVLDLYDKMKKRHSRGFFRISGLGFEDKRDFLPLQAADLVAYEMYRLLPVQLGITAGKRRGYMDRIHELPVFLDYLPRERLKFFDKVWSADSPEEFVSILNSEKGAQ